ncbi:MAG TPA: nucleotide disphospho-sugar-binding domain-containing protein [Vicinamibacterales bacterium]
MRCLLTVWNFPGCVHPFFALGEALRARGHEVAVYTGAEYERSVREQGFAFFPFHRALEEVVAQRVYSPDSIGANWHRPWKVPRLLKEFMVDSMPAQIGDLNRVYAVWRPDVVASDPALLAPYMVQYERTGVPVALLSYVLGCQIPGPDIPPVGLGLPLPKTRWQAMSNRLTGKVMDLFLSDFRTSVDRIRVRYGLKPLGRSIVEAARRLPLYLVTSCPELDYPRTDLPETVHYVGACFWYPRQHTPPPWLETLPSDPPCVYVNEGTIHVAAPFLLRAAREGLAKAPIQVVLTTGTHRSMADLGLAPLPDNFLADQWIDHDLLLPKMSAMVCTGGPGTVLSALRNGVPMVVVATEWDHPENAQRMAEAGVALRLERRHCTAQGLRAAVERVLGDPSFRHNAERISRALARQGGPGRAAELLERLPAAAQQRSFTHHHGTGSAGASAPAS